MKIKEWIVWGVLFLTATASTGLGAEVGTPSLQENVSSLEKAVQAAREQVALSSPGKGFRWAELETFQRSLWRAMALDPSPIAAVPPSQVPKALFAAELNQDLTRQLEGLKNSPYPKQFNAEVEFAQYTQLAEKIVSMRKARQFPQVRAIAKHGTLDNLYQPLVKRFEGSDKAPASADSSVPALADIADISKSLREQVDTGVKATAKKDVFANGTHFIWFMLVAFVGFFLGIFGYRFNPNFFQKLLDYFDSNAPTATTTTSGARLDYARWLREFEEHLSRLKSTQQSHERRIDDIVQTSEKIVQHALSLYADARIKNEANLEFRMSTLVREIQYQFDQSQKLQAGDRAQINLMLEHTLGLCDAIENNAVAMDQQKLQDPNHFIRAS